MNPHIVRKPVITEKSLQLANTRNTYTFLVDRTANKTQIAEAVKDLFSVNVLSVRTVTKPASSKKTGRRRLPSVTAKQKKAFVTIKEGQVIELFDVGSQE